MSMPLPLTHVRKEFIEDRKTVVWVHFIRNPHILLVFCQCTVFEVKLTLPYTWKSKPTMCAARNGQKLKKKIK